jgi:ubiquinone/menaquinone biosynthesis C-methylase UbiE
LLRVLCGESFLSYNPGVSSSSEQRDRVRQRFTRTAEQFATFSLSARSAEAAQLVALAAPRGTERALDLACGPGTFTHAFAPRVRSMHGVDITPALLEQARGAAEKAQLVNVTYSTGDAVSLPYANGAFDLVTCAYAIHHFAQPAAAMAEAVRVLRPGGRLALVDIIVPEGADPAAANAIERARDASHEVTFTAAQLRALLESAGLRVTQQQPGERERSFDDWMQIAGWSPGDSAYAATRRLLETHLARDSSGFAPRRKDASHDLAFTQHSYFLIAEKS